MYILPQKEVKWVFAACKKRWNEKSWELVANILRPTEAKRLKKKNAARKNQTFKNFWGEAGHKEKDQALSAMTMIMKRNIPKKNKVKQYDKEKEED